MTSKFEQLPQHVSMAPALSEFFDASPVPSFAIDANHIVTQWNKACEHITGVPATAIVGTENHWQPFYKQGCSDFSVGKGVRYRAGLAKEDGDGKQRFVPAFAWAERTMGSRSG